MTSKKSELYDWDYLKHQIIDWIKQLPIDINGKFKNCEITDLKKTIKNNFFYRFTFHTNFHYLSEKEQIINEIYVHNNEIVQGDLSGYPVLEGRKQDISLEDIKKNYQIAKKEISPLIENKTKQIAEKLNQKLELEIQRIKKHFEQLKKEINEKIKTENEKLDFFKNQLNNSEEENQKILKKIQRIEKNIEKIKKNNDFYKIENEEKFTIKDLKQKHSLNIDNKLFNTTVIYYPLFTFILIFNNNLKKQVKLTFNPLTNEIGKIFCNQCQKEINELCFCSEGHVICNNCVRVCRGCGESFCESCLKYFCEICNQKLCKNCIIKCLKCKKLFCKNHTRKDSLSGEIRCINCLKICPKCKTASEPQYFKKNSAGIFICPKCYGKEIGNKISQDFFQA